MLLTLLYMIYGIIQLVQSIWFDNKDDSELFRKSTIFWPLYAMSLIVTALLNNLYSYNRDLSINIILMFMYVPICILLATCEHVTLLNQYSARSITKKEEMRKFPFFYATFIQLWVMYILCTTSVGFIDLSGSSNLYIVIGFAAQMCIVSAFIQIDEKSGSIDKTMIR